MAEHAHGHTAHAHHAKESKYSGAVNILLVTVFLLVAYNQYLISTISTGSATGFAVLSSSNLASAGSGGSSPSASGGAAASSSGAAASTGDEVQDAINAVIPTGTPAVYGSELGVSFDTVGDCKRQGSCLVLEKIDDPNPKNSLTPEQLARFVRIGKQIGCDVCCGLKVMTRDDGSRPCGCAHSHAMRGLAQYLIKNHGSEYTDEQILAEVGKWKNLFFPKWAVTNYLQSKGGNVDTSALPSQVGGC